GIDEAGAARLATQHLLDMGHRRINYLCSPGTDAIKLRQLKQVLLEAGVGFDPDWLFIHEDNGQFGEILSVCSKFAEQWQNAPAATRPSAMICHSDPIALAAISALNKAGIRVPGDVSLIGCDNLPESPFLIPALTTMECRINEQMAAVVDLVTTRIKHPERKREVRIFEPELIPRESVRRIGPGNQPIGKL
ncbi:MAG: substrate-binding domain-containing protein, partial [Kiritimatiellales bacterium]|nr:substrate-binding domain-containing protein [Kiritimatiellales bacterium]